MKAVQFLEQANVITPKCLLPVVSDCRFATFDYLGWGVPMCCGFTYKSFEKKHKEYVPDGPITWEDWTFSIRETYRNLNLTHDQAWRLANNLLTSHFKSAVETVARMHGFKGFCWNNWKELVGKHTNSINPITEAEVEMGVLTF